MITSVRLPRPVRHSGGFTLAEMVMVIAITGIIAGIVAVFMRAPVQGYFDLATRAALTDNADTALRRIGRDLRLALPNSVRINAANTSIEFLQTSTGGRYRSKAPGNVLNTVDEPSDSATATFDVLGTMNPVPSAGNRVVVYNLGISGADAYEGSNSAVISAATASSITMAAAKQFPFESPSHRFQVVDTPVTYRCTNGTLTRYWGYAIAAAQPDPPEGGQSALIAENVSGCLFTYDPLMINEHSGLVSMQIQLTKNNETVTLYHEVHVSNVP